MIDKKIAIKTTAATHSRPLPVISTNPWNSHAKIFKPDYYLSPAVKDALSIIKNGAAAIGGGSGGEKKESEQEPELVPFKVDKKNGFVSDSDLVIILDEHKRVFYFKKRKGPNTRFNLPVGEYFLFYGNLKPLPAPVRYKIPNLPRPYAYSKKPPLKFKIIYCENKNKCSVDISKDTIYFDHSFKNYPRFIIQYIIRHEKGHYFYRGRGQQSELDCDKFAAVSMLESGFNPSQISAAVRFTLSNSLLSEHRKKSNFENVKNLI